MVRVKPAGITLRVWREIATDAASSAQKRHGAPKVVQTKIVRDETRTDARGAPRSRGFGFVEFAKHEHALAARRHGQSGRPGEATAGLQRCL